MLILNSSLKIFLENHLLNTSLVSRLHMLVLTQTFFYYFGSDIFKWNLIFLKNTQIFYEIL
jgi:hypothetical protein